MGSLSVVEDGGRSMHTEGSCHRERVGELYGDITCGGCDQEDSGDCLET